MESFEQTKKLTTEEQLEEIKTLYRLESTEEEKRKFDEWCSQSDLGSFEFPKGIKNIEEVLLRLPKVPNYSGKRIELFFSKEDLSIEFLENILGNFKNSNCLFEIGIHQYASKTFSVEIGSKTGGVSPRSDALYIGHFHPHVSLENIDAPPAFIRKLVPSSGDIKGFFSHIAAIKKGTIIVSPHGRAEVRFIEENPQIVSNEKIEDFKEKYFALFLGRNELGWQTDEDIKNFYKNEFGLKLEFM